MERLTISEYQEGTEKTAIYRDGIARAAQSGLIENWANLSYCAHGLTGEAGELSNDIKKVVRDDGGLVTPERAERLFKEIGDCYWYLSQICNELGFKIENVMDFNLSKLASRQERGVLTGSGNDR